VLGRRRQNRDKSNSTSVRRGTRRKAQKSCYRRGAKTLIPANQSFPPVRLWRGNLEVGTDALQLQAPLRSRSPLLNWQQRPESLKLPGCRSSCSKSIQVWRSSATSTFLFYTFKNKDDDGTSPSLTRIRCPSEPPTAASAVTEDLTFSASLRLSAHARAAGAALIRLGSSCRRL
jgi:hypothetical protein